MICIKIRQKREKCSLWVTQCLLNCHTRRIIIEFSTLQDLILLLLCHFMQPAGRMHSADSWNAFNDEPHDVWFDRNGHALHAKQPKRQVKRFRKSFKLINYKLRLRNCELCQWNVYAKHVFILPITLDDVRGASLCLRVWYSATSVISMMIDCVNNFSWNWDHHWTCPPLPWLALISFGQQNKARGTTLYFLTYSIVIFNRFFQITSEDRAPPVSNYAVIYVNRERGNKTSATQDKSQINIESVKND